VVWSLASPMSRPVLDTALLVVLTITLEPSRERFLLHLLSGLLLRVPRVSVLVYRAGDIKVK
jgi:hypothetical protein